MSKLLIKADANERTGAIYDPDGETAIDPADLVIKKNGVRERRVTALELHLEEDGTHTLILDQQAPEIEDWTIEVDGKRWSVDRVRTQRRSFNGIHGKIQPRSVS